MEIQQLRFDKPFQYELQVAESVDASTTKIPPLFAQPFVENAIEHGIIGRNDGYIHVLFAEADGTFWVEIEDNGQWIAKKDPELSKHKSLATTITKERLDILSKPVRRQPVLQVDSSEKGTRVKLEIPVKKG